MNVAPFPTLISATCGSETTADLYGTGATAIGVYDYLLVAWLPIATCYYGNGVTSSSNYPITTKLGGVCYSTTSNLSSVALWPERFDNVFAGRSMSAVYGSDM